MKKKDVADLIDGIADGLLIAPHQNSFSLKSRKYEGLFHGTGTGKTRTALYSVRRYSGSILIVAPKTTVQKKQWEYESQVLGLKPPTVISYETFRRDYTKLPKFKAVIADEAHRLFGVMPTMCRRNKEWVPKASQIFEAMQWYLAERQPVRFIPATATPNKTPMSIWAAAKLLGHDWSYRDFRDSFYHRLPMDRIVYAPHRDQASMDALAEKTREIGQVLRLADIKDVPVQTYKTEYLPINARQSALLKTLPAKFPDPSALRTKKHQIENGILYEDIFDEKTKKVSRKVLSFPNEKVDYIVERSIEFPKMIVFANYTEQVDIIAAALEKEGKLVFKMTGKTKDRKAVETAAEAAESAYIIAQSSVSSEWEFKTCPVVIFASLSNKSIDYIQGQGRPQRYDAIKHNLYIHLIADHKESVDRRWFETIMSGRDFNEALYDK